MKTKILSDNILKRMSPEDRRSTGQQTSEEALLKFNARNEGQLQKVIVQWLNYKGIFVIQSRFGVKSKMIPGTPDICCCWIEKLPMNGTECPFRRPMAIEVKFGKGELSEEQEKVRLTMIGNGWNYYVVRSLQQVMEIVRL